MNGKNINEAGQGGEHIGEPFPRDRIHRDSHSTLKKDGVESYKLDSALHCRQSVIISSHLFDVNNATLQEAVGVRKSLVVMTPTIERIYGDTIRHYFEKNSRKFLPRFYVLHCTESTKTIEAVLSVCHEAALGQLDRMSPIIGIGGGVCTDICGLAATLFRRSIPHIKIPTTLLGLVDAGIGIKNGVNFLGKKSGLGTYSVPEYSLIDSRFLETLPQRQLVSGVAEIIKMAVIVNPRLFDLLEGHASDLLKSGFQQPREIASEAIELSIRDMLHELSLNLYEAIDYRRKVDFGHTFSPYIEMSSSPNLLHGEAVAIDIALSSQVAFEKGLLSFVDLDRILSLLENFGLPIHCPQMAAQSLWEELPNVVEHRNGNLHLVVPTSIGDCAFIGADELTSDLLNRCIMKLLTRGTPRYASLSYQRQALES